MYKLRIIIGLLFLPIAMGLLAAQRNNYNPALQSSGNQIPLAVDNKITWINANIGITDGFYLADTALRTDDKLFAFGTNIRIPKLVNPSGEFETLNLKIYSDFDLILQSAETNPRPDENEYRTIFYDYYLNDSIITIKITDLHVYHLSEATTTFLVYHFDYKNNRLLNTTEVFEALGLSRVPVLSAFAGQCTFPPDYSEPLFNTEWYEQVKWTDFNKLKFYSNQDKQFVIIYQVAENGIENEQVLK